MTWNGPTDNPYNPDVENSTQETLPLDEILRRAIQSEILKIRVMIPARVIKVNSCQNVDIQPLFKTRYIDGSLKDLPPIQQVPVSMIMGNDYSIKIPVAVGDIGYAIFCDRSTDSFISSSGEIVDPASNRNHDMTDAVFQPGGIIPSSKQLSDSTTDFIITNGKGVFKVQKAGTFATSNGTNEMMDLLVKITDQLQLLSKTLSTDTTNTWTGPTQLNSFSIYNQISLDVKNLEDKLKTLKGA